MWNPEEKHSYAWLTQTASKHGGVKAYLDSIAKEAYEKGKQEGFLKGVMCAVVAFIVAVFAVAVGIYVFPFVKKYILSPISRKFNEIRYSLKKKFQSKKEMQEKTNASENTVTDSTNTTESDNKVNDLQKGGVDNE